MSLSDVHIVVHSLNSLIKTNFPPTHFSFSASNSLVNVEKNGLIWRGGGGGVVLLYKQA